MAVKAYSWRNGLEGPYGQPIPICTAAALPQWLAAWPIRLSVYAQQAQNAELWDVEGRRYIDFASGIAVLNTGHVHPAGRGRHAAAAARS